MSLWEKGFEKIYRLSSKWKIVKKSYNHYDIQRVETDIKAGLDEMSWILYVVQGIKQ